MPSFLVTPLVKYGLIALAIGALVVAWRIEHANRKAAEANAAIYAYQVKDLTQTNRGLSDAMTKMADRQRQSDAAIAARDVILAKTTDRLNEARKEAARAPLDPVCPIDGLATALDWLRNTAAPASDREGSPGRTNPNP